VRRTVLLFSLAATVVVAASVAWAAQRGTPGDDVIRGDDRKNTQYDLAGDDRLVGRGGNDAATVDRDTAPDPDVTDLYVPGDCEDVQFVNVRG
jgi:hypothetical protein